MMHSFFRSLSGAETSGWFRLRSASGSGMWQIFAFTPLVERSRNERLASATLSQHFGYAQTALRLRSASGAGMWQLFAFTPAR